MFYSSVLNKIHILGERDVKISNDNLQNCVLLHHKLTETTRSLLLVLLGMKDLFGMRYKFVFDAV